MNAYLDLTKQISCLIMQLDTIFFVFLFLDKYFQSPEEYYLDKDTKRVGKRICTIFIEFSKRLKKENFDEISVAEQARVETSRLSCVLFTRIQVSLFFH